ncbi:E3 ubiquitin-protein ligase Siah2 isoform X2 [Sander lucioperca]|uniref:E3 ubiquitin-protein ligase Siah2 isoform X2 n=1 Tax=Sander lucioperca TaxID=283035 RepID=UPI0016535E25|nr:E3 ubiquitin-protein ligase Siah2 isoform X2 [Sander lucioperca]XP_035846730.1 E3 ubiquitin-protein ligase Siah2 isoform X2 [Sander lucioperca]
MCVCVCVCVCVSAVCVSVCSMLCPASCLPLLRELAQWRCLLGWHRHHGVGTASAPGLTANAGQHQKQQGSEVRGSRPVGRTKPLPGNQYSSAGCGLSLHHTEKPDHEEVCEFRPYTCPCPGATCKWHGSLEAVMPHLMHAHKSITTLQGEDIVFLATDINLPGAVDWVMMQSCFSHHFMLVLEKQEKYEGHQQFFAVVLLIGTRKQAENFAYRLELNGNRRRLTWEATPRSIHDGVAAAIMNSDCLVFDTSIAHLFADNGNLGINVTISMC